MATNPMQRKANNYLLMGVLGTLLVTGVIIAILFMNLNTAQQETKKLKENLVDAYVVTKDIKSGARITAEDIKMKKVDKNSIPTNALKNLEDLSLQDEYGRSISIDPEKGEYYFTTSQVKIFQDEDAGYYYIAEGAKQYIKIVTVPLIAKIEIKANTVVTEDMVSQTGIVEKDLRKQEYNMIILPSQIANGDFVDIRLSLSNGLDYIVVSKKEVTIPEADGVPSATTVSFELNEEEIMTLSNAIVESYIDKGSMLYATTYIEPGMQENATPTYIASKEVLNQINIDPNIKQEAKINLMKRWSENGADNNTTRMLIENAKSQYIQDKVDNIEAGVQEQITKAREERERYLETLGGN